MTEDDPQHIAATSRSARLLVIAPPGCGKTELLAQRTQALIPQLLPGQKILALTFTNRAKANLSERLRRTLGAQRMRRYVTVHNFHGHAAGIVLAHGRTIGLQVDGITMPTTTTLKRALRQCSGDTAACDAAAELLATIKRGPLTDDEVAEAIKEAGDPLALQVETDRIAGNQLHYDDLLRHAQRLLGIGEVARLYQQHYGAVLVDEYQDLSLQQLDLAMRTCTTSRTFAGDPLQGIYSWAGAEPKEVGDLLRRECGDPVQLAVSYRSSPAVLAMVNAISASMGAAPLRAYDPAAWADGGASAALDFATRAAEAEFIAAVCEQITTADPAASVGVISRAAWRRTTIDTALAQRPSIFCRRWDLAAEDPGILDLIRSVVSVMPPGTQLDGARAKVIASLDPGDVDTIEQVSDAITQLGQAAPGATARTALAKFRERDHQSAIGPGVHLLNAHTGKGQQFDWVIACGLEEGHLPGKRNSTGNALDEEQRVLLVILSRARNGVIVTRASTQDGRFGPYSATPSRWWNAVAASATLNRSALERHMNAIYPVPIQKSCDVVWPAEFGS
jgi:DNA helicase II / ATP-dependent DNA helicase PcrA